MTTAFTQVPVLDTAEGETALLTAIINARPVGMAKHWAMVSILLYLEQTLGEGRVTGEDVWNKLRTLYDLDLLDEDVSAAVPCPFVLVDGISRQATDSIMHVIPIAQSDLNTANEPSVSEEDPSSSTSAARKRRRPVSATADTSSLPYDLQSTSKSEFNLLDKRSFQEEFAKRRKSSQSPSPSPVLSSTPLESDGDEEEVEDDDEEDAEEGENTVMIEDDEEEEEVEAEENEDENGGNQEEEEEEQEEAKPARGRRSSSSRGRPPKRGSVSTSKRGTAKKNGPGRSGYKSRRRKADDDDAVSETASTLSALSEDGEGGPSRRTTGKEEEDEDDEQEHGDDDDAEEEVALEQNEDADDVDSGTEPDIGPDDTPFKTPKGMSIQAFTNS